MNASRHLFLNGLLALCTIAGCLSARGESEHDVAEKLAAVSQTHPRLFLPAGEDESLKGKIDADPELSAARDFLLRRARALMDEQPVTRDKVGRRLLGVSRTCLERVTHWAMAYRLTGDATFARRAETEMVAAAGFTDWNPSHFLDVAEMTAALGIGYDWLYPALTEEGRTIIRDAIVDNGLKTSLKGGWWVSATNNWNQVCHGGLTIGALAVLEDEPELAEQIIERALSNLPRAMHEYEPDGVYPEGPSYWVYGTTYNVLLNDVLQSVLGTDFGLSAAKGFMQSPEFFLHATGPTGLYYNFSDCGTRGGISPAMYWFARERNEPSLLWHERDKLRELVQQDKMSGGRFFPFLLLWSMSGEPSSPATLHWQGGGPTPVAIFRTAWEEDATYAGFKGGSPYTNHAHMDIGSFIVDMQGVRWAVDLGSQSYHSLESKGVDLWNRKQDSERWTVFRLNSMSHSTLVVDDQLQRVSGDAPMIASSLDPANPFAVVDMATVYDGQLAATKRGLRLVDDAVIVRDELTAHDRETRVRWAMTTRAAASISEDGTSAVLEQDGKEAHLRVLLPEAVSLETVEVETPPQTYDAQNPDTRMVAFEVTVPAGGDATFVVLLTPRADDVPTLRPLAAWGTP